MSATAQPLPVSSRVPGLLGAAASTDHKRIGLHIGLASLGFFLAGGVLALLMRAELAAAGPAVRLDAAPTTSSSRCTARR